MVSTLPLILTSSTDNVVKVPNEVIFGWAAVCNVPLKLPVIFVAVNVVTFNVPFVAS